MTMYQSSSSSFACHSLFCNREYDKHKHNLYPDRMCSLATRDKRLFVEASLVDRGQGVGDSKHHHRRRHHSLHCHTIFRRKSYGDFMHRNPHKGRPPVPNRLFFLTLFKPGVGTWGGQTHVLLQILYTSGRYLAP